MRRIKKILSITLIACIAFTAIGCNVFSGGGGKSDPNTLYVGNYDGGLGEAWLRAVADKFEAQNPGIKVEIDSEKDLFGDTSLMTNMPNYRQDMYFLNQITYSNYVKRGVIADITDVVTEKRSENRLVDGVETEQSISIEDKMHETQKAYYKTSNGKYYAVPFVESIFGAVYDVDLFDEKGYYFDEKGTLVLRRGTRDAEKYSDKVVFATANGKECTLGNGPDGKIGTFDDGLPATYSDLFALMDQMKLDSVTPFMWNGQYPLYRERFLTTLWADYEGAENYNINSTFSGSYTFEGDDTATVINNSNAYLLQNQKGKEIAVDTARKIIRGGYYLTNSFDTVQSHIMVQGDYLYSRYRNQPVAFIIEGGWWENESRDKAFASMAQSYGEEWAYGKRKFAFLPTPKVDESAIGGRRTILSASGGSVVCVNAKTTKKELAEKFIAFAHSDESLRTFTTYTGVPRPYDYELSAGDENSMTYFSRDLWEVYHDENTDVVYNSISFNTMKNTEKTYFNGWAFGASNVKGVDYEEPFLAFRNWSDLTTSEYLAGMRRKYDNWNKALASYLV